jgi:hypothetical protein
MNIQTTCASTSEKCGKMYTLSTIQLSQEVYYETATDRSSLSLYAAAGRSR